MEAPVYPAPQALTAPAAAHARRQDLAAGSAGALPPANSFCIACPTPEACTRRVRCARSGTDDLTMAACHGSVPA